MDKQYTSADIDAYLSGQMDEAARSRFEAALNDDAQLAEQVDTFRAEKAVFQLMEKEALLDQLQAWDEEEKERPATKPFKWILLVVILALLGALAFYLFSEPPPPPPPEDTPQQPTQEIQGEQIDTSLEQSPPSLPTTVQAPPPSPPIAALDYSELAANYYRQAPFADQLKRSVNLADTSNFQRAQQYYQNNDFAEALQILNAPDSTQLRKYLYLRAHTHYQLRQYPAAQRDFAAFREFRISNRKKDAAWGEVLSLLQQMPQSRPQLYAALEEIITQESSGPYGPQAQELLNTLRDNDR